MTAVTGVATAVTAVTSVTISVIAVTGAVTGAVTRRCDCLQQRRDQACLMAASLARHRRCGTRFRLLSCTSTSARRAGAVSAVIGAVTAVTGAMPAVTTENRPSVGTRPGLALRRNSRVCLHRPTRSAEARTNVRVSASFVRPARRQPDLGSAVVSIVSQ